MMVNTPLGVGQVALPLMARNELTGSAALVRRHARRRRQVDVEPTIRKA
jgi:hypothetical protein